MLRAALRLLKGQGEGQVPHSQARPPAPPFHRLPAAIHPSHPRTEHNMRHSPPCPDSGEPDAPANTSSWGSRGKPIAESKVTA